MKKKLLITGAAGFVGLHLINIIDKKKFEVLLLVKNNAEKSLVVNHPNVIVADLSKKGSWQKKIYDVNIIVHLAAQISSKNATLFKKNNVKATENLLNAAKKAHVKNIILFSSAAVTSSRLDEYAKTKQEKENLVTKSGLNYAIIRPSMIYGPADTKNIGWLISVIDKLPLVPLPGGGNFGRQPVYVEDICKIVVKLAGKGFKNELYEIHGMEYITMKKMVNSIKKHLNSKKIIVNVPLKLLFIFVKTQELFFKNPKFTTDQIKSLTSGEKFIGHNWPRSFGIIPTKFEAGIAKMINKQC